MVKYKVNKDFLTMKAGDIVSISSMGRTIIIHVENREIDVKFYGNDRGRYGIGNPTPKDGPKYRWQKEVVRFSVMNMEIPETPQDLSQELMLLHSPAEWMNICIEKVIQDFKDIGVF